MVKRLSQEVMSRTKCTWQKSMRPVLRQKALHRNTETRGTHSHTRRMKAALDPVVDFIVEYPGPTPVSKVWLELTPLSTPEQSPTDLNQLKESCCFCHSDCGYATQLVQSKRDP